MTLVDLSEEMLTVSRQLILIVPTCGETCERSTGAELRCGFRPRRYRLHDHGGRPAAGSSHRVRTCGQVCRGPRPRHIAENFEPGTDYGGDNAPTAAARDTSWSSDPDPTDTRTRADYAFLLRKTDGSVRWCTTRQFGLFPRGLWLRVLTDAGFGTRSVAEVQPRTARA